MNHVHSLFFAELSIIIFHIRRISRTLIETKEERPEVLVGPFAEGDRAIAGFTLIETESEEEAIEWTLRMPDPHGFGHGEIELRQLLPIAKRYKIREFDPWRPTFGSN